MTPEQRRRALDEFTNIIMEIQRDMSTEEFRTQLTELPEIEIRELTDVWSHPAPKRMYVDMDWCVLTQNGKIIDTEPTERLDAIAKQLGFDDAEHMSVDVPDSITKVEHMYCFLESLL
jgi:hypothetical protein